MLDFAITGVGTALLTYAVFMASSFYLERDDFKGWWRQKLVIVSVLAGIVSLFVPLFLQNGYGNSRVQIAAGLVLLIAIAASRLIVRLPTDAEASFIEKKRSFHSSWAGVIVNGLGIGFLINIPNWTDKTSTLTNTPPKSESGVALVGFVAVFVISLLLILWFNRRRYRKLPSAFELRKHLNRGFVIPSLIGIMIASLQYYTRNISFTNRYYTLILTAIIVVMALWGMVFILPGLRTRLRAEHEVHEQIIARQKKSKRKRKRK